MTKILIKKYKYSEEEDIWADDFCVYDNHWK